MYFEVFLYLDSPGLELNWAHIFGDLPWLVTNKSESFSTSSSAWMKKSAFLEEFGWNWNSAQKSSPFCPKLWVSNWKQIWIFNFIFLFGEKEHFLSLKNGLLCCYFSKSLVFQAHLLHSTKEWALCCFRRWHSSYCLLTRLFSCSPEKFTTISQSFFPFNDCLKWPCKPSTYLFGKKLS